VALLVSVMWVLGSILGPKRPTPIKLRPFECGFAPFQNPGGYFDVKFYLVAILFVIFDVELAFLFPWAVVFREIGATAFWAMGIFIAILACGLWYDWKKGALKWR
jgi:NADH-quinone oxidoreductase subunit A